MKNADTSYLEGIEAERTRLAREIHDSLANELLALQMKVQSSEVSQDELVTILKNLQGLVRNISHALMPPVFQHSSLPEIINDYVRIQNEQNEPVFEFYFSPQTGWKNLPHRMALNLYRIMQEACGNALKHARAKSIIISMIRKVNHIELSVSDNGTGFPDHAKNNSGIGLQILGKRVTEQKGKLDIISKSGKGTYIRVIMPVVLNN